MNSALIKALPTLRAMLKTPFGGVRTAGRTAGGCGWRGADSSGQDSQTIFLTGLGQDSQTDIFNNPRTGTRAQASQHIGKLGPRYF